MTGGCSVPLEVSRKHKWSLGAGLCPPREGGRRKEEEERSPTGKKRRGGVKAGVRTPKGNKRDSWTRRHQWEKSGGLEGGGRKKG